MLQININNDLLINSVQLYVDVQINYSVRTITQTFLKI